MAPSNFSNVAHAIVLDYRRFLRFNRILRLFCKELIARDNYDKNTSKWGLQLDFFELKLSALCYGSGPDLIFKTSSSSCSCKKAIVKYKRDNGSLETRTNWNGPDSRPFSQIRVEKGHQFHFTALVKILTRLRDAALCCVIKTTPKSLREMHSCQKRRPMLLPTCYFCVQFFNVF